MSVLFDDGLVSTGGYEIANSLMFRGSQYLSRTPVVAGNRKVWTYAFKFRRGSFVIGPFLTVGAGYPGGAIGLDTGDVLSFWEYTGSGFNLKLVTTQVFRDPSAWYDVVIAFDSTQAVSTDRVKIWVNGVRVTAFTTSTYPAQNYDSYFNNANIHKIGTGMGAGNLDGYVAEPIFVDGLALDPSYFGKTDPVTGQWVAKKYTGTYGTNGFYLGRPYNGADIGKDYSGQNNNWMANGFSASDVVLDTPSNVYATLNSLDVAGSHTFSNGSLTVANGAAAWAATRCSMALPTSGKWAWKTTFDTTMSGSAYPMIGIAPVEVNMSTTYMSTTGNGAVAFGPAGTSQVQFSYNKSVLLGTAWSPRPSAGQWYEWLFDADAKTLTLKDQAGTVLADALSLASYGVNQWCIGLQQYAATVTFDFGQKGYTPPAGYKSLCTKNLPDPSIKNGKSGFNAIARTGNGVTPISVSGVGHKPDLVWSKTRSVADDHRLVDSVRGSTNYLFTNLTSAEQTGPSLTFTADGFDVSNSTQNVGGRTYVDWSWKKGAAYGLDIVTYTGNGVVRTVAHSLGMAPKFAIIKARDSGQSWAVYHNAIGATNRLNLNTTGVAATSSAYWNDADPTSYNITLGTHTEVNANGINYIAYLFSEVEGYSKFGSYKGNGSADGAFVYCGFKPRWVMIKRTDTAGYGWAIFDTERNKCNVVPNYLMANSADVEQSDAAIDILSNGFKFRNTGAALNASGGTYIYAAFAECPTKFATAR